MKKIEYMVKLKEFTLGTHLPVLQAVLKVFKPSGVMELGVGLKSTPLLYDDRKLLVSIESDLKWLEKVKPLVPLRDRFELVHHDIGHGIHVKTKYKQITPIVVEECIEFYSTFVNKYDLDFLFIDHVSGLRAITLTELFDRFLIVAYHDAQHPGYCYEKFLEVDSNDYLHFMFESLGVYTGILIHGKYVEKIKVFNDVLKKYGEKYCEDFDVVYDHKLREIK